MENVSVDLGEQVRQPVLAARQLSFVFGAKVKSLEALTVQLLCQVCV